MGVILLLLLVGVAILRRSYSCPRKSFAEKTLASSSGEGLDPDVVQSIKRADVVSCVQEERTKEESDPMFTNSEQRYPHGNGGLRGETHQITVESRGNEALLFYPMPAHSFDSPRPRCSYDMDRQRLNLSQEQSEDSGVSESESDNELKLPEVEENLSFIPSTQRKLDQSYIGQSPSRAVRLEDQGLCGRDSGCRHPSSHTEITTECSSVRKLYGISEGSEPISRKSYGGSPLGIPLRQRSFDISWGEMSQASISGKSKRGPPVREEATAPVEVICLTATPTGVPGPLTNESQLHDKERNMHFLPQSEAVLQTSDHPNKDPAINPSLDRRDIGVPVTLYKAYNGELLLLARKPSDYEGTGVQLSAAPAYAITTLPKATGKKSKSSLGTRPKEKDFSQIEEDIQKSPVNSSKNKDIDTKQVGRRDYVPPTHPDVCQRESSV